MDGDFVVSIRGELCYAISLVVVMVELALKTKLQDYNTMVSKLVNGAVYKGIPSLIWSFLRHTFVDFRIAKGSCHNKITYATRTTSQQTMLAGEKHWDLRPSTAWAATCQFMIFSEFSSYFVNTFSTSSSLFVRSLMVALWLLFSTFSLSVLCKSY